MTAQPSSPFDMSPALKMYMDSMEFWKKNYENVLKNAKDIQAGPNGPAGEAEQSTGAVGSVASTYDAALVNWQKSGEELFKRFVQNQIELCHFFGSRWEQYLKLPSELSQCRSLSELGNLQASFLSQFASDYMQESQKLAQPVAELMMSWTGEKNT